MQEASLCVLTCGQVRGTERLIRSIKSFGDLDIEVVVGDNSIKAGDRRHFQDMADVYFEVDDHDLWFDGFGAVKQKIVSKANRSLCLVGDPDEKWFPWDTSFEGGVMRTAMLHDGREIYHGRVFNRRLYRYIGIIHEELYHRRTRAQWHVEANKKEPFARIAHSPDHGDDAYLERKRALYDGLLYRAYKDESLRYGISPWWFESYIPAKLALGWEPMSFDEWRESHGG